MAPLPPESTARYFFDYSDGINDHTIVARLGPAASVSLAEAQVVAFFNELDPVLNQIDVIGARIASDNSNVTNPVAYTGPASFGTAPMPSVNAPREVRFIGRSTDGRRVSVSVYGYSGATPATYRINGGVVAAIDNAILQLALAGSLGVFLTISTQVPVWKPYASFNFNSYWEREARP